MIFKLIYAVRILFTRISHVLWSKVNYLRLIGHGVSLGRGFRCFGAIQLFIHPTAKVTIGRRLRLISGFRLNAVGGFRKTGIWVGSNGRLTIGENVGISNTTIVCIDQITIGDNVFIGGDCKIYDTDFHPIDHRDRNKHSTQSTQTAAISIEDNCFIGGHTIILKGVVIGSGSIVGAGSVVTRTIPPGEIWAGVPAKKVKVIQ